MSICLALKNTQLEKPRAKVCMILPTEFEDLGYNFKIECVDSIPTELRDEFKELLQLKNLLIIFLI